MPWLQDLLIIMFHKFNMVSIIKLFFVDYSFKAKQVSLLRKKSEI